MVMFDLSGARIYVAGHLGMVGSAIVRALRARGCTSLILRSRKELDLLDQAAVFEFLRRERPDLVFIAAAKVGGIEANIRYGADFLYENLQIAANLIHGCHLAGVQRLMYFASNCIYPRSSPQPMSEAQLLTGPLEPTNEPYAIAKISGLKMCESYQRQHKRAYISVIPASLYGPNDNYHPASSHVLPALLRRAHEARERNDPELVVWGSGTPRRELLYVDDLAEACLMLSEKGYEGPPINVGFGGDLSIRELAQAVIQTTRYTGRIVFDQSKPDGIPQKLLDSTAIRGLGWRPKVTLLEGLEIAYRTSGLMRLANVQE